MNLVNRRVLAGGAEIQYLAHIRTTIYWERCRPEGALSKLVLIRRGDRVITGGGLFGTVTKVVSDGELVVQIAEAVKVRVARGTISEVVSKTEPAQAGKTEKAA